jgi:hypothetical protein
MKARSKLTLMLVAAVLAAPALAQQTGPAGAAVVTSEPGRASAMRTVEVAAQVVGIDKATRTLTLKRSSGKTVDVVAGDEVKSFDQIKVGDSIVARYLEALTLELKKVPVTAGDAKVREEVARSQPGEKPAGVVARQVSAIATVVAVDPAKSTITIKGPRGDEVALNVQNPEQFKVVKKGDQIEVTYTQALALSLEPAPPAMK